VILNGFDYLINWLFYSTTLDIFAWRNGRDML